MKVKTSAHALILLLIPFTLAGISVQGLRADSMWIEPNNIDGNVVGGYGAKFNVTIWLNVTSNTNAWQWYLIYDKSILNWTGRTDYTGPGKSQWSSAYPADTVPANSGSHNSTHKYVIHGEVLKSSAEKTGVGSLSWVEFKIIKAPAKYETLTAELRLDIGGIFSSFAQDKSFNPIALTFGHCSYTYPWLSFPSTTPAVSPTIITFGTPNPPPNHGGYTESVDVYLNDLSVYWGCRNVTLDLIYDNNTLIDATAFTIAPLWGVGSSVTVTHGAPGPKDDTVHVVLVNPSSTPSGNVLLLTIGFTLLGKPILYTTVWTSSLLLQSIVIWDSSAQIPYSPPINGVARVMGMIVSIVPLHLEVSDVTLGPNPARGELFNVTVSAKAAFSPIYLIGLDFRLTYNPALITPVAAYEGPFMRYFAAHQPGSLGTWFVSYFEPPDIYPEHVIIGDLIIPNASGRWGPQWPKSGVINEVIAIISFQVKYQSFGEPDKSCTLGIFDEHFVRVLAPNTDPQEVDYLLYHDPPRNGTATVTTSWPGRVVDLYNQYPAPFGGQGIDNPSDMFWPQKQPELYANVTYNYWPIQQKDVAFEVRDNHGNLLDVMVARTDANGVAHADFRIPWPCDHPEQYFGVWTITATVDIACVVVNDTMRFHFDYMVEIFSVTIDKFQYNHCDTVKIAVTYGSHAQQTYPLLLCIVIKDNLNIPIGSAYLETTVSGTIYCQYKNWTKTLSIHIPKFAFAGIAHVYVTAYNMLPTLGGSAWCPTYGMGWPIGATVPEIAIQPY